MSTKQRIWSKKKKERLDQLKIMRDDGDFEVNEPEQRELAALQIEYALWLKRDKTKDRKSILKR